MKISKEAAALLRKLMVKPMLMPEWEINKKEIAIAGLKRAEGVRIVGSEKTGRFVGIPEHFRREETYELMILDMVADKKGIVFADLLRWTIDLGLFDLSITKNCLRNLINRDVLVLIDAEDGQEVALEENEHEVMPEVIEDDGTIVRFV